MKVIHRKQSIRIVVFCQFVTASAALGLAPFFSLIMKKSFGAAGSEHSFSVGILYILPALLSAFSSPIWGRLADRFDKKMLLMRAQIGLALSFLVIGYASSTYVFYFGVCLQGLLGGTFSASRAYLAGLIQDKGLASSLTLLEAAPRAALFISPFVVGYLLSVQAPMLIYRYLALLPLLCVALTLLLPKEDKEANKAKKIPRSQEHQDETLFTRLSPWQMYFLQLVFSLSSTCVSPYFYPAMQTRFPALTPASIGLVIGIPHLIYLLFAFSLGRRMHAFCRSTNVCEKILVLSFLGQALSFVAQAYSHSLVAIVLVRLFQGMASLLSFISLHELMSRMVVAEKSGGFFGTIESVNRLSMVLAGLLSSVAVTYFNLYVPFLVGALVLCMGAVYLFAFLMMTYNTKLQKPKETYL